MKFDNLIQAVKALRAIPQGTPAVTQVAGGGFHISGPSIGLKDAKDIVEACMALGVQRFLEDHSAPITGEVKAKVLREFLTAELSKIELPLCNRCGARLEYPEAPQPCNSCYSVSSYTPLHDDDIKF